MHEQPQQKGAEGDILYGQGIAWARYVHSKWPGFGAAWSAWVADVEVNKRTGEVHVKRVVVGQDAGLTINPAGVEHQIHGNVVQTTSRTMLEQVPTERARNTVATREWGSYPILSFRQVPVIEVMQMPRHREPALGAGESASVPGTAAIANAIFDATGVRFRQPPFTPEVVRAALNPLMYQGDSVTQAFGQPQSIAPVADTIQVASLTSDPQRTGPALKPTDRADAPWPRPRSWWVRAAALTAAPPKAAVSRFFGRTGASGAPLLAPPPRRFVAGEGESEGSTAGALAAAVGDALPVRLVVHNRLAVALPLRGVALTMAVLQEMTGG